MLKFTPILSYTSWTMSDLLVLSLPVDELRGLVSEEEEGCWAAATPRTEGEPAAGSLLSPPRAPAALTPLLGDGWGMFEGWL